jgi:hypothetical protein
MADLARMLLVQCRTTLDQYALDGSPGSPALLASMNALRVALANYTANAAPRLYRPDEPTPPDPLQFIQGGT